MDYVARTLQDFELLKSTSLLHWKLYLGANARDGKVMAASENAQPDAQLTYDISADYLKKCLRNLMPGTYMIQFKTSPNTNTGIISRLFTVDEDTTRLTANQPNMGGMLPAKGYIPEDLLSAKLEALETRIRAEYKEKEFQKRLDEFERELKRSKKETGSELLKQIVSMGSMALNMYNSSKGTPTTQIGIAGVEAPPVPEHDKQEPTQEEKEYLLDKQKYYQEVYDKSINEIFAREGSQEGGVKLVYCLNRWIEENPEFYENLKPTLLQYSSELEP